MAEFDLSGIAAIVRFDGGDVPLGAIEQIMARQGYRGIDGTAHWRSGPVALGFCATHATVAEPAPAQPLASADGQLVLVFNGYLHHPEELRSALVARGVRLRTSGDAELVLHSFAQWGEECAARIEGEFAFVIWDARRRRAYCARDHAGLRTLFYWFDGKQLVVASDIAAVLAAAGVVQEPNQRVIVQIMANEFLTLRETVWKGVMRLLPACWATFDRDGEQSATYWAPPREVTLRYARDADYAEHYRDVLDDCVRQASRSHLPVGIDVSGGLDSSAVFAVADKMAREGRLQSPDFRGYTFRFGGGTAADEIRYARNVANHVGRPLAEIEPFSPDLDWFVERGRDDCDACPYPNTAMTISIGEKLVADGCRVWINGEGGDEWLGGRPFYYSEQLSAGDLKGLLESFRLDRVALGWRTALWRFYRYGLGPHAPAFMRRLRRRMAVPRGPNQFDGAFWLDPAMDRLLGECRAEVDHEAAHAYTNIARRAMFMELKEPFDNMARDQIDRQCARIGYESRSPLFARRFIDFAFSVPERTRLRGDIRKFTHVEAMTGVLPESVRTRKTKADFGQAFERLLDGMQEVLVSEIAHSSPGRISTEGIARLYRGYQVGPEQDRQVWELWGIFACEAPGNL